MGHPPHLSHVYRPSTRALLESDAFPEALPSILSAVVAGGGLLHSCGRASGGADAAAEQQRQQDDWCYEVVGALLDLGMMSTKGKGG